MSAARKFTLLELALLGLIRFQPQSGYDLRKQFTSTPLAHFSGSPGAVYPALKRLKSRGLLEARVEKPHRLRRREVFALSGAGQQAVQEWLRRLPTRDEVVYAADELLLRFASMQGLCTRAHTVKFLKVLAEESEKYAQTLDQLARDVADDRAPHGMLAVQLGADECRARADWARRAMDHFKQRSKS